jgi:ADP-ribose pyrophosphatase
VEDEPLEVAARRELREEAGATSDDLRYLGAFYSSAANLTLRCHVYLALDVAVADPELEDTELLAPLRIPAQVAFEMARRGEINEGQSALALLFCEQAILAHLDR